MLGEEVRQFLSSFRGEFLFGNTAPDVQVVSGQPRQQTHFFNLPILAEDPLAWKLILSNHPGLVDIKRQPAPKVAFIAGYLCHLQADWFWVRDVFAPSFGPGCTWSTFDQRLFFHNVLRAYLDDRILPDLSSDICIRLQTVEPYGWLPFVRDHYLAQWRDFLFPQLQPGASPQTVKVFSSRQGISAPEFQALLKSETRMKSEVFTHLLPQQVENYHRRILIENIKLLSENLSGSLQNVITPSITMGVRP